jgi:hypothetical protein
MYLYRLQTEYFDETDRAVNTYFQRLRHPL